MITFLVDSDWLIDAANGRKEAVEFLSDRSEGGLAVSIIAIGEVYEGAFRSTEPMEHLQLLRRFLAEFPVVNLDDAIVAEFGSLRAWLRKNGNLIPDLDLLIASTAIAYDLTLLTRNLRHFTRIPNLQIFGVN